MAETYKFLHDTLHVGYPSVIELSFDDSVNVLGVPNVLGVMMVDSVKAKDSTHKVWDVHYTTFKLGQMGFDSLAISYVKDGESHSLYLNGAGPVVGTSILDTNYKSSYFGFADYPLPKGEVAGLLGLFAVIVILIFIAVKAIFFRPKPPVPKPFYEDPDKSSLEKYNELMAMNLWQNPEGVKEHYFILTEIVKFHLSVEYKKSYMEFTSSELLTSLKSLFQFDQYKTIKQFFEATDIVKYTTMFPGETEISDTNSTALSIISIKNEKADETDH